MLSGYRGLVAATGLAITILAFGLGLYIASLNYPKEQRHQPYRYATDKPLEVEVSGAIPSQAFEYRTPCQNPKGNNESDLCAQWRAAKAAEESAFWTKWGFWAGIGGMIGLFWTLYYTREAVRDTSEATAQMRRQNTHAEETAKKQLRAYLDIFDIEKNIERRTDWDEGGAFGYKISIHINNFGQTPARHVRLAKLHGVLIGSLTKAQTDRAYGADTFDIPPNGRHQNVFKLMLTEEALAGIVSGALSCFVYCDIEYRDVFGDPHRLKFTLISKDIMWGDCVLGVDHGSYEST